MNSLGGNNLLIKDKLMLIEIFIISFYLFYVVIVWRICFVNNVVFNVFWGGVSWVLVIMLEFRWSGLSLSVWKKVWGLCLSFVFGWDVFRFFLEF